MQKIHIVYICSPDRDISLLISLGSLIASGTQFDRVTIYCVGNRPSSWVFSDPRILVEEKSDLAQYLWMENKTYLSAAEGDNVVFIDADTIVLKPLNLLCHSLSADVSGRLTTSSQQFNWNSTLWEEYLRKYGAKEFFPYLNTGLLIFTNGSHRRLNPTWLDITRNIASLKPYPFGKVSKVNQIAFSLTCASLNLSYYLLSSSQHTYGWEQESFNESIVFHTGNKRFINYIFEIDKQTKFLDKNPLINRSQVQEFLIKGME